jgi:hypothetical protein
VTEMVAFFERVCGEFRLYNEKQFGIVHVRTDDERLFVATHSGKDNQKESYTFIVSERVRSRSRRNPGSPDPDRRRAAVTFVSRR